MSLRTILLTALCGTAIASSSWSFTSGKATLARKGDTEGTSVNFDAANPISSPLPLSSQEVLKLSFVLQAGSTPGRPHQAFLLLSDPETHLETFFPLTVKPSSGRGGVALGFKDISPHLLSAPTLDLSLVIGSFGDTPGAVYPVGKIVPVVDTATLAVVEKAKIAELGGEVRYGPKEELAHTFRADAESPAIAITLAFTAAVLASFVGLIGVWFGVLGANLGHLPKALQAAPVSHVLFFGSLLALEGVFVLYYTSWNLFQAMGALGVVGTVAFFSGSRALTEVSARRERGER